MREILGTTCSSVSYLWFNFLSIHSSRPLLVPFTPQNLHTIVPHRWASKPRELKNHTVGYIECFKKKNRVILLEAIKSTKKRQRFQFFTSHFFIQLLLNFLDFFVMKSNNQRIGYRFFSWKFKQNVPFQLKNSIVSIITCKSDKGRKKSGAHRMSYYFILAFFRNQAQKKMEREKASSWISPGPVQLNTFRKCRSSSFSLCNQFPLLSRLSVRHDPDTKLGTVKIEASTSFKILLNDAFSLFFYSLLNLAISLLSSQNLTKNYAFSDYNPCKSFAKNTFTWKIFRGMY